MKEVGRLKTQAFGSLIGNLTVGLAVSAGTGLTASRVKTNGSAMHSGLLAQT